MSALAKARALHPPALAALQALQPEGRSHFSCHERGRLLLIPVALVALSVWLAFRAAPMIARRLGKTGIHVVTRLMGLIIAAISIEMIASGLVKLFPGLLA